MGYTHLEIVDVQTSKKPGAPCGDIIRVERTAHSTIVVCSDGLGSGIKANFAALLCVSRLLELIRRDHSLREAFGHVMRTMNDARDTGMPYAVFSIMQFRSDGETTILTYEMPPPIFISRHTASVLGRQTYIRDEAVIGESNCYIEPGEGILLVSDGITQAGLGRGLPLGWGIEGVCETIRTIMTDGTPPNQFPLRIHQEARRLWRDAEGDDCTAVLAWCRKGTVINIFTGPPANPGLDMTAVRHFLNMEGIKIVCGATTAKLVSTALGRKINVIQEDLSLIAPPRYEIEGIDLVTEGAVTLNQAFNILEEDTENYGEISGVTQLCKLLKKADRVNFLVGTAHNLAEGDISFRQQGILPRATIVRFLADQLRKNGKFVTIERI